MPAFPLPAIPCPIMLTTMKTGSWPQIQSIWKEISLILPLPCLPCLYLASCRLLAFALPCPFAFPLSSPCLPFCLLCPFIFLYSAVENVSLPPDDVLKSSFLAGRLFQTRRCAARMRCRAHTHAPAFARMPLPRLLPHAHACPGVYRAARACAIGLCACLRWRGRYYYATALPLPLLFAALTRATPLRLLPPTPACARFLYTHTTVTAPWSSAYHLYAFPPYATHTFYRVTGGRARAYLYAYFSHAAHRRVRRQHFINNAFAHMHLRHAFCIRWFVGTLGLGHLIFIWFAFALHTAHEAFSFSFLYTLHTFLHFCWLGKSSPPLYLPLFWEVNGMHYSIPVDLGWGSGWTLGGRQEQTSRSWTPQTCSRHGLEMILEGLGSLISVWHCTFYS